MCSRMRHLPMTRALLRGEEATTTSRLTVCGKELLLDGKHWADASTPEAAVLIYHRCAPCFTKGLPDMTDPAKRNRVIHRAIGLPMDWPV